MINKTTKYLFAFIFYLIFCTASMLSQQVNTSWQANPELVEQLQNDRPEYIWHEENVPDYVLPDPLVNSDATRTQSPGEWVQKREQILNLFRSEMYGKRPGKPENLSFEIVEENPAAMNGQATLKRISIKSQHQNRTHEFGLILFLPNNSSEPVPVFLLMNNRDLENTDPTRQEISGFWPAEMVIERGYGIAAIQNNELAPDDTERYHKGIISLFEGEILPGERAPDAWMALAAWGWGASRVMDYFETDTRVDAEKIALLGHSRGGKAALWAGAEDERFSLVISNESGSGGAALSKRQFGETVEAVNRFTHWFAGNYKNYNHREDELPFDQHMLLSLIAPRAVYVASADEDLWADPRGEFLALVHSSPVYSLWNERVIGNDEMPPLNHPLVRGARGYHIRSGGHNLTPQDWEYFIDFADLLWE